jgi:predicted RNA binding protein YcfA (HicA-like mRNA interferase family)
MFPAILSICEESTGLSKVLADCCQPPTTETYHMSPKIRELIDDLIASGCAERGGKGSHRNLTHPRLSRPITISGKFGDDAKPYQIKAVRQALKDIRK